MVVNKVLQLNFIKLLKYMQWVNGRYRCTSTKLNKKIQIQTLYYSCFKRKYLMLISGVNIFKKMQKMYNFQNLQENNLVNNTIFNNIIGLFNI